MAGICVEKALVQHLCGRFVIMTTCIVINHILNPLTTQVLLSRDFVAHVPSIAFTNCILVRVKNER